MKTIETAIMLLSALILIGQSILPAHIAWLAWRDRDFWVASRISAGIAVLSFGLGVCIILNVLAIRSR